MTTQKTDEIDLGELLVKIKRSIISHRLLIIALSILGLIVGVVLFYSKPNVYESEMVIYSEVIEETLISTIGENLDKIVSDRNHKNLANKLSLPDSIAAAISSIEIDLDQNQKNKKGSFFTIRVDASSNAYFNQINAGIINYLSSNEYVKKRVTLKKENYQNLISKLNTEIGQIDSLKGNLSGLDNRGRDVTILSPSMVYETLITLYKDQLDANESLELAEGVEIIDTIDYSRPVSAGLFKSAVVGFGIGLMISFMIIFLLEVSSYIKQYEKQ
ncbi:Wzz/FepE/Etk N-terminal domain-containing protein [Fulvivirga ligni]|uniref:Wzz/FepE/Etk N-terminal domain-containing protein n=1 Tax=Fulvivirga ligni TaxID=2904246 RepID=UPI001F1EF7BD|nr:Wzz/FepE/Etk N-terminal domain-containing protein [Fulvivirga ligni]UII22638.1 Wzz/FepE/Etk N-terminal domain-containing protein [Fulvivirga ligni]